MTALTTEAHGGQGDSGPHTQLPYRTRIWAIIRHCSLHMVTVPRFAAEGIHRTQMRQFKNGMLNENRGTWAKFRPAQRQQRNKDYEITTTQSAE